MRALYGTTANYSTNNNKRAKGFYNTRRGPRIIQKNGGKYLNAEKLEFDDNNDSFWEAITETVSKCGITKIDNLDLVKKNIPDDLEWKKYNYSLDVENSSDDFLKIPQPTEGKDVKWCDIKNDNQLRHGVSGAGDSLQKYVEEIEELVTELDDKHNASIRARRKNSGITETRYSLLIESLINFTLFGFEGGKQTLLLQQSGWTFENESQNEISLAEIPSNYGITSIIRNDFFEEENKNGNFHEGITGIQNIIGSPFTSTNLHKEHGNMHFLNHLWEGHKLWITFKDDNGVLINYFANKLKYTDCCKEVHYMDKEIWWELSRLIEIKGVQFCWTIQRPGETIIGSRYWFHQVLHLTYTEASSFDFAPDTPLDWLQLLNAIINQQNYENKHNGDSGIHVKNAQCHLNLMEIDLAQI